MEQPQKGTAKRHLANVSVPVELDSVEDDVEEQELDHSQEKLRFVNLVSDAVDVIVKSRSAAIEAIRDGHMASNITHLELMVSQLPEHIRKMPMKEFLKQHCPNTNVNTRPDGTLYFDHVPEPATARCKIPGEADTINTGFESVHSTPGCAPSQTSTMRILSANGSFKKEYYL